MTLFTLLPLPLSVFAPGFVIPILAVPALAALMLAAGFLYQAIGGWFDRRLRAPGRLVETAGSRLYLLEKGQGGPSVVFESGFGATSLNWAHIQDAVARHTHTVAYDRAGLGWSSPARSPRTPAVVAAELRSLLAAAGIQPPYILCGHSFGGLVMQRFALDYPQDTAAVLLIDPMRTHEWPPINAPRLATVARARRLGRCAIPIARFGLARLAARSHLCCSRRFSGFLVRLGGASGAHLAHRLDTEIGKMPAHIRPAIAAHWSSPAFYRGFLAHLDSVAATVAEMHTPEPIRDRPVTVLTPISSTPIPDHDMRRYGPFSRQIIASRSEHWIHLDEPALVIDTLLDLLDNAGRDERENELSVLCGAD